MKKVYLTFDCEDFINPKSIVALNLVLELLKRYNLKAIFFLTGQMGEKLRRNPEILTLLMEHEIGYHCSSHSVHPNIFEYTDEEDYNIAYEVSLKREQSKINPVTGEIEGPGGLLLLRELFPGKKVVAFRAPGFCWAPPHLQALQNLGIKFDFSTHLSRIPFNYKKITFYPYPTGGYSITSPKTWASISLFRYTILMAHPRNLVKRYNDVDWDSIYYKGNPKLLYEVQDNWNETKETVQNFESFLKAISRLAKEGFLHITPPLEESVSKICFTEETVIRSYRRSIRWAQRPFNYNPKYLLRHFFKYFNVEPKHSKSQSKLCL